MTPAKRAMQSAAIMMGILGGCWLAASLLIHLLPAAAGYATILFPVAAVVATVMMSRLPRPVAGEGGQVGVLQRQLMWATYALEIVLIAALVLILSRHGLGSVLTSIIAVAVGVHFFPLGAAFRMISYYMLGAIIALLGVAGGTVLEGMQWLVGALTGLALVTGAVLFWKR